MRRIKISLFSPVFLLLFISGFLTSAYADPTHIIIRVKAKDAKFIGSSMGGALIIIRDTQSGRVLAQGKTTGGTGNTHLLMNEAHKRYQRLSDAGTAKFETTLDINLPTLVTIEAHTSGQNGLVASTQTWLIPGKNIEGDGIILNMPGFIVSIMDPGNKQSFRLKNGKATIPLKMHVVMMCGCPITPNGLWDANHYEIKALVLDKSQNQRMTVPMNYAGVASTFSGSVTLNKPGTYDLFFYAYDPITGNTGVDRTSVIVSE